jgi:hypothetical protein
VSSEDPIITSVGISSLAGASLGGAAVCGSALVGTGGFAGGSSPAGAGDVGGAASGDGAWLAPASSRVWAKRLVGLSICNENQETKPNSRSLLLRELSDQRRIVDETGRLCATPLEWR